MPKNHTSKPDKQMGTRNTHKTRSSPEQSLKNTISRSIFKPVNYFKDFQLADRTRGNRHLRESLGGLADESGSQTEASAMLTQWNAVVEDDAVAKYWVSREMVAENDEFRNHYRIMRTQAARQHRALGEKLTREVEHGTQVSPANEDQGQQDGDDCTS